MTASPDDRTAQVDETEIAPEKASAKRAPASEQTPESASSAKKTTRTPAAKKPATKKAAVKKPAAKKPAATASTTSKPAARIPAKPASGTAKAAAEKAAPTTDVVVEPLAKVLADSPVVTGGASENASSRSTAAVRAAAAKNTAARTAATKAAASAGTPTSRAAGTGAAASSSTQAAAAKTTATKAAATKTAAAKAAATKAAAAKTAAAKTAAATAAASQSTARSATAKTTAAKTAAAKTAAAKTAAAKSAATKAAKAAAAAEAEAADAVSTVEPVSTIAAVPADAALPVETVSAPALGAPIVDDAETPDAVSTPPVIEVIEVVESVEVVESDDAASDTRDPHDELSGVEAISIRGLVKNFGDNRAVHGIDLTVPAGSFYGVVGPNGAGKTTTLSIVAGLLRADEGSVTICGIDQATHPQAAKRLMGVLPDRLRTFDRLTGRQLLYYYGLLRGLAADVIEKRAADLARAFDLGDALSRVVSDYSAGMTKKIMLAGAMIHSPRVLVLDEPFESVDPVSSAVILDILRAYVSHGGTVILSSHGMDLVERVCSRVAIIVGGEVLAEGTIDEVRSGQTLEARFVELAGSSGEVEGLEWLHTFSD